MKKTIALILAVIMLLSAVPMQSFAAFDWLLPEAVKIEVLDNTPISNKYVQYIASDEEMPDTFNYGLNVGVDSRYKIHLSNGRTLEVDNYELVGTDLLSGVLGSGVFLYVNSKECAEAVAEGKSTVKVSVSVYLYYTNNTIKSYHFETEKPIVEEIVKDVRLLDSMPEHYSKTIPAADFIGKRFEVEYADGRKEILTVTKDSEFGDYHLGNEIFYVWYGENSYKDELTGETVYYEGLEFDYIDANIVLDRKFIPCPYSGIEITDHKINGKAGLTELTYKLSYKDGRVLEKTCTFTEPVTTEAYAVIDTVDGYDVTASVGGFGGGYTVYIDIGHYIWGIENFLEGDIKDFCDCRCHKDGILNYIINVFIIKIWQIFGINEYCNCGDWHW